MSPKSRDQKDIPTLVEFFGFKLRQRSCPRAGEPI